MFSGRKLNEIHTMLGAFIQSQDTTVAVLQAEVARLRKENQRLTDRIMAVDYTKFQMYQQANAGDREIDPRELLFDEENAIGEVVEGGPEDVGRTG